MSNLKYSMHCFLSWLLSAVLLGQTHCAAAEESLIERAVEAYSSAVELADRDARIQGFAHAEQLFEQAAQEQRNQTGRVNPELLINLGNAALQAQHLGRAIASYRQALQQVPGNQQASQNLQAARDLLPEAFKRTDSLRFVDTLFFWKSIVPQQQLALWAALCFMLGCLLIAVGIARRSPWLRTLALMPFLAWFALLLPSFWDNSRPGAEAVVHSHEAWLYSVDSENSALRLTDPLPDGTEVEVLESRDRWTEVQVASRTGWLRTSSLLFTSDHAPLSSTEP